MLKSLDFRLTALTGFILFAVLFSSPAFSANHPLKRQVSPKQVYTALPEHSDCNTIVLKLSEGTKRPNLSQNRFTSKETGWDRLNDILSAGNATMALRPLITVAPARLDEMRAEGSRRVGWQLPDLALYYEVQLADDLPERERLAVINQLNDLNIVELAYFAIEAEPASGPPDEPGPPDDKGPPEDPDPGPTPSFEFGQFYLRPAPVGFDAFYAWSFPGGHGENAKVIDIEAAWNQTHEDLHGGTDDFYIAGGINEDFEQGHGTAVLGIIASDSNDFGMTGIAYETELGTVSIWDLSYADAITTASANAGPGDMILLELTAASPAPNGAYICMEWEQASFDAILTASALGRIVVEVAANSNQNYDDTELFDSLFYPDYRFSGAIMVAMSTAFHVPDARTCYGQRLDVHGFGTRDIYTLALGDLWGTDDNNAYTTWFSGTSAASAEVAAVCAVVESIYEEQTGSTLDHAGMRSLLTTYSVPQADHYKHIGPMPDLAGICDAVTGFVRPAPPTLVSPDDAAEFDAPAQPMLDWDDVTGALSYDVMIDDNFNFTSPVAQEEGLTSSEWTLPMLQQGKYFWRARAVNASGFGSWSDVRTILVDVQIEAPILLSPEDGGAAGTSINIPLEWYPIDGVVDYVVEVDSFPDFSTMARSTYSLPCTDGTCSWVVAALFRSQTYYWRVRVLGDSTPWSEEWEFITRNASSKTISTPQNESAVMPVSAILHANYPNPFNPVTEISFGLPGATHARLDIFNILGQRVATLVDEYLPAGDHSAVWNAGTKPSGVYLYRLTTSDAAVSRKMLLIK